MRAAARTGTDARKADTRRKIELGGLVLKSGMGDASPAALLGALLLTARKLAGPEGAEFLKKIEAAGDAEFSASTTVRE